MDILHDLRDLEIDTISLKPKFKKLEGTRFIIQYENPEYVFTLSKTLKPKITTYGVTNRCEDGKFILFLDYDKIYKRLLFKNLDNLLKKFPKLFDNFYIACTDEEELLDNGEIKGSYHVINFVKHFKADVEKFMQYCDVDPHFIKIPQKTAHKCHVLRYSEKIWTVDEKIVKQRPKFLQIYPENLIFSGLECSLAHYLFFSREWLNFKNYINAKCYHKFDKFTKIELHKYATPKKVD